MKKSFLFFSIYLAMIFAVTMTVPGHAQWWNKFRRKPVQNKPHVIVQSVSPNISSLETGKFVTIIINGNNLERITSVQVFKKTGRSINRDSPVRTFGVTMVNPTQRCGLPRCRMMQLMAGNTEPGAYQVEFLSGSSIVKTMIINVTEPAMTAQGRVQPVPDKIASKQTKMQKSEDKKKQTEARHQEERSNAWQNIGTSVGDAAAGGAVSGSSSENTQPVTVTQSTVKGKSGTVQSSISTQNRVTGSVDRPSRQATVLRQDCYSIVISEMNRLADAIQAETRSLSDVMNHKPADIYSVNNEAGKASSTGTDLLPVVARYNQRLNQWKLEVKARLNAIQASQNKYGAERYKLAQCLNINIDPSQDPETMNDLYEQMEDLRQQAIEEQEKKAEQARDAAN